MKKILRCALMFTCVMINPLTAMMSSDAVPCPAPVPDELTAERLVIRANALFGDRRLWRYYNPAILKSYLDIADAGDQDAINKAHVELNKVAISREFNKFSLF